MAAKQTIGSPQTLRMHTRLAMAMLAGLGFAALHGASCEGNGNNNNNNNHNSNSSGQKPVIDPSRDHIMIADDAEPTITVVEYGDLECPGCGSFARNHFAKLKSDYIDTGKIRFVFRHYPLNGHPQARPLAEASECVANQSEEAFFEFVEEIYSSQPDSTDENARDIAEMLGLNMTDFDDCLASDSENIRVQEDFNSGNALDIEVTPTFFVEDQKIGRANPPQTVNQEATELFTTIDRLLGE